MSKIHLEESRGVFYIVLSAICFSAKAVLVKLVYIEKPDPVLTLALRMAFALPFFLWVAIREYSINKKDSPLSNKDFIKILLLGFLGYYLSSLFDFIGLKYVTASIERLIIYTYPTIVLLMHLVMYKRPPSKKEIFALLFTYVGVGVTFFDESIFTKPGSFFGIFMIFLCTITYSWYIVEGEGLVNRIGAARFTSYALLVSSIAVLLHFVISGGLQGMNLSSRILLLSLIMGIISTVIPTFLFSAGVKRIGSSKSAIIGTIGPVSTIILSYFFLGEEITVRETIGSFLIIAGVLQVSKQKKALS